MGVWLLASPFVLFTVIFVLYAVVGAAFSGAIESSGESVSAAADTLVAREGSLRDFMSSGIRFVLGVLGMAAFGLLFIGVPIGMYLIVSKGKDGRAAHEEAPPRQKSSSLRK